MFESTTMRLLFYACTLSTLLLLAVLLAGWTLVQRWRGRARLPVAAPLLLLALLALGFATWDALNEALRFVRLVGLADRLQPGPRSAIDRQATSFGDFGPPARDAIRGRALHDRGSSSAHSARRPCAIGPG